jgi:2-polyprenyl-3-methyl-5-hydroxy-6-metoxy-1,4-benzoquinol methylase
MKALDRFLQRWRVAKVRPFIPLGARVLDIGCEDGLLFRLCGNQIHQGIGLDPILASPIKEGRFELLPGRFPESLPETEPFDVITMLAVLEHIPESLQREFAENCGLRLKPGGLLLITTPAPQVDRILTLLLALRLIDGMSLEEHHGFDPLKTPSIFSMAGLTLVKSAKFQWGLNNLFVFKKAPYEQSSSRPGCTSP